MEYRIYDNMEIWKVCKYESWRNMKIWKISSAQQSCGPATVCITPSVRTHRVRQRKEMGAKRDQQGAKCDAKGNFDKYEKYGIM